MFFFFFQAEDGIRDAQESRGLGDVYKRQVKAPSGKNYVVNGYVNDQNIVERVETWLGDNIMGNMHIVATYTGWKDFGGVLAPSKIVQTRGGWPFFEVVLTEAKANPSDVATLVPP